MAKNYLKDVYIGGTEDSRELYASWAAHTIKKSKKMDM